MHSLWFKERGKYSKSRLIYEFGNQGNKIISRLQSTNILRPIKDNSEEDSIDDMIEISDGDFQLFTFNFCGTILLGDYLIHCYPKYINKQDYKSSFPLVLKAIQKYQKKNIQKIYMAQSGNENYGLFPLILAIVKDYQKNGLYHCVKKKYILNGPGETDWQATIEKYDPYFINKKPFYFDRDTFLTRNDEENLFRLIHMAVIEECYSTLGKMEIYDLFSLHTLPFRGTKLRKLGNIRYLLRLLKQEYAKQFAEKRRNVLNLLISYLEKSYSRTNKNPLLLFGTNSMHSIWEDALSQVLGSNLHDKVKEISTLPELLRKQYPKSNQELINIIDHPKWEIIGHKNPFGVKTLRPDLITIKKDSFIIFDAKYYAPVISSVTIKGQPELESITKQYLYHMAYKDFIDYFNITNVKNVFLIPHEARQDNSISWPIGTVVMDILSRHTMTDIDALYVHADRVWQAYINGEHLSLS